MKSYHITILSLLVGISASAFTMRASLIILAKPSNQNITAAVQAYPGANLDQKATNYAIGTVTLSGHCCAPVTPICFEATQDGAFVLSRQGTLCPPRP